MEMISRCDRCGSAGSVEFGMCQVCFKDFTRREEEGDAAALRWEEMMLSIAGDVGGGRSSSPVVEAASGGHARPTACGAGGETGSAACTVK